MWLCIDQGGHSTRAAVIDATGQILAEEKTSLEASVRDPYFVEHDARELLESVGGCLRGVARQLGRGCSRIRAAGLATQRSTIICATRSHGQPLSPLISWRDRRGQDDLKRFEVQADRIKALTGLRLSPHYGVGKLRWCLRRLGSVQERLAEHDVVGAPLVSFLLHHLVADGRWRVDPVNASRTLLMSMRDSRWSTELCDLFEVPMELLPEIQPCRSDFGALDLGGHAVPLTVATGDQAAAVYCVGEPGPATAFVNIGTGAFIQAVTGATPVLDEGLLSSIVWQDTRATRYVLEGTVNGAAAAISVASGEIGRRFDPAGQELLEALERISDAPFFLNGVSGLGSPDWIADFPSRFVGAGNPAQRTAAVYESIVFLIARNVLRMQQHVPLSSLTVTGGVSRMDWLAQYLADTTGLPVVRPIESEATLLGLAQLVSEGQIQVVHDGDRFEPRSSTATQRRFDTWTAAMDAEIRQVLTVTPK